MCEFIIYKFVFIDRRTRFKCEIFARTEEKAIQIMELWNSFQDIFHWSIPRIKYRYKTKMITEIPPYEIEQEQIDCIESWRIKSDKSKKDVITKIK